jgi:hypothetical protein
MLQIILKEKTKQFSICAKKLPVHGGLNHWFKLTSCLRLWLHGTMFKPAPIN